MSKDILQLFPPSVLDGTEEERLTYFRKKLVAHPHLSNARYLAQDNIDIGAKGELVAILGPSEVGTTTLASKLHKYYEKEWPSLHGINDTTSMIFSLAVSAPSSSGRIGDSYWKRLLKDLLCKGGDLLVDKKVFVPPSDFQLAQYTPFSHLGTQDLDGLMAAVLSMVERRGTKVILINQAERLFPENDKAGWIRSRQILTDLAGQTTARIVLIANYQILQTTVTGGDWLQRRNIVHLRRYDRNNEEELQNFNSVLEELLGHIPGPRRLTKLSVHGATDFYVNSVGCIGTLKKTLLMAVSHSCRTGEKLTEDFFRNFFQPNVTAVNLAKQARLGERLLMDVQQTEIERILDEGWVPEVGLAARNSTASTGGGTKVTATRRHSSFSQRIGERKPTRDPVGGVNAKRA